MKNRSFTVVCALGAAMFTVATIGPAFAGSYVEYVDSDRTQKQAIDSGYYVNPKTRIVADFAYLDITNQQRLFGVIGTSGSVACQLYINGSNYGTGSYAFACSNNVNNGWTSLSLVVTNGLRRTFTLSGPDKVVRLYEGYDGSVRLKTGSFPGAIKNTAKHRLALFGNKSANDTYDSTSGYDSNYGSIRLWSFKIYEGDALVKDYRPYKDDDGKYCLKERVGGTLLYPFNGSLLAGGDEIDLEATEAKTVLLAPGYNVTTNVSAIGGDVDVVVNKGLGSGGIVNMDGNNRYIGTTTLNGGTLVADNLTAAAFGSLGSTKTLYMDAGTFKYNGGTGTFTRPIVMVRNPIACGTNDTKSAIFDITGDLTLTGAFTNLLGGFVKTGPGTLRIPGGAGTTNSISLNGGNGNLNAVTWNANGDSTIHGSAFEIIEGTLVLGEAGGTFNIHGSAADAWIGKVNVDPRTDPGVQEKSGVLEVRGGTVNVNNFLMVGVKNGFEGTTPNGKPQSGIRVYAGTFDAQGSVALGRNKSSGVYTDSNGNFLRLNTAPFLEVHGGLMRLRNTSRVGLCDNSGADSRVFIDGGRLWVCNSSANTGGVMIFANCTDGDPAWPSYGDVSVCTNGQLDVTGFYIVNNGRENVTVDVKVFDGGRFRFNSFYKNSTKASNSLNLLLDGGIAEIRYGGYSNWINSDVTKAEVGTRGVIFRNASDCDVNVICTVSAAFQAKDTHPGEETQGATITTLNAAKNTGVRFTAQQAWAGPTRLLAGGVCELDETGAFPAASAVTMEPGASFTLRSASQTFPSLTLGAEGTSGAIKIGLLKGLSITANVFELKPGTSVAFSLYETVTNGVTAVTSGDPLTTAGTYTLLTVPAASASDLTALARGATVANAANGVRYTFDVTTSGGTASLTVTVGATASDTIAAASGETETVTSPITGDYVLRTNPTESGAGTVDLDDSLAGFEGSLVSGSGTTKISDLSFVGGALDWVIGPGTLWYTGAATEVPGITIDSGASGHCGELKIDDDVTILSAATRSGSMCKSGTGDLILKGNGYFQLGKVTTSWKLNGTGNVPQANGDGRTTGFGSLNVSDGRIVVGTANDPDDAPSVDTAGLLNISPRTTEVPGAMETFGEFVMNNGSFNLTSGINIGYYVGMPATTPEGVTLRPKLTLNGGTLNAAHITMGVDATGQQTCSPEMEINGGELTLSTSVVIGYQGQSAGVTNKVVVNGGLLSTPYLNLGHANDSNGCAPGRFEINGGEVLCRTGNFTVGNKAVAGRQELYLNGGRLTCRNLTHTGVANSTDIGSAAVYFRGGVLKLGYGRGKNVGYTIGDETDAAKRMELYVGAAGAKFDFTDWFAGGEDAGTLNLRNQFLHDPDCAGEDGGLWFNGGGTVLLRAQMSGGTFNGPIRASGGFMLGMDNGYADLCSKTFIVEEGSGFRASAEFMYVKNVTLGTAGGTKPVLLDFCANRSPVGLIVSNELAILSPVTVSFHVPGGCCNTVGSQLGTYGVLYYPASQESQVDLSKFVSNPKLPGVTMTFTKADSDYAANASGMRMVKVTITATDSAVGTTWTGAANDGKWTTGDNWNGNEAPNGRDAMAVFPAAHAGTSVAVGNDVTVGRLALYGGDGTGYTFTGTPKFEFTDFKTAPGIVAESGTHVFADGLASEDLLNRANDTVANGNRTGGIEVKAKTGSRVTINGQVKADYRVPLYINNPTSGGGTTVLNADVDATEVKVQSGMLEMSDMSHLDGKTLTVGPGTFHYTGPAAVSSAKIVTNPGTGGQAIASILRIDDELTLTEKFDSQSASLMKSGPGTLIFAQNTDGSIINRIGYNGSNTNWNNTGSNWYWPANGDSRTNQGIGSICVDEGEVVLIGGPDTVFHIANNGNARDAFIGAQARGWNYTTHRAALTIYSGTVKGPWVYLGHTFNHGKDGSGKLIPTYSEYNQYGGNVTFSTLCFCYDLSDYDTACQATANIYGGTLTVTGVMRFGQTYNKTGVNPPHATMNMYGGVYNHTDTSGTTGTRMGYLGSKTDGQKTQNRACDATLNMFGGEYNEIERIHMGCNASTSRLNLHGGVLKAENIFLNTSTGGNYCFFAGGKAYLYWNGGAYAPIGTTAANQTLQGLTEALVSTNGAVVTTAQLAGESYTIAQPLLHDPALSGKDGGFTKVGAEPLALAGANTYNGDTYVAEGQLVIPANAAETALPPDSAVIVAPGAELVMASGTAARIGVLAIDMTKTYGTINGLAAAKGGKLYLTNVSGDLKGRELPITLAGDTSRARFGSWELYVDGVKVNGLVPSVNGSGKLVLDLPFGACIIIR
ncbi:MAG: hypothetical protein IJH50_03860 [Kiritimatiellae bacterium]|nr:hypothetical protein [Kiritimatiellia bacterium]